jgi:taurine dioxygenase
MFDSIRRSTPFDVVPIGRFGAVVEGFDFGQPADIQTERSLRSALAAFQLLLFRGQVISPGEQLRFTGCFGDLDPGISRRPRSHQVEGHPDLLYISNTSGSPTMDYGAAWHSDGLAYARRPHGATVLCCIDCPVGVGDTLFANQYAAFEAIPESLLESMDGLYWYLPPIDYSEVPNGKGLIQPILRLHPETRRNFVYCSPQASRIRGKTRAESDRILGFVHGIQIRDDLVYRHSWRPGDVIVWENCALLHNRADLVDIATQGLRAMHRSATSGDFEAIECEAAPQRS